MGSSQTKYGTASGQSKSVESGRGPGIAFLSARMDSMCGVVKAAAKRKLYCRLSRDGDEGSSSGLGCLANRSVEQVADAEAVCLLLEIAAIERFGLRPQDAQDVGPLPFGRLASGTVPLELG